MSVLSKYCKAYPLERLTRYVHWRDLPVREARPATDYVFLHDNYIVTRSMFLDQDIVFKDVTPEWIAFCDGELKFAVPQDIVELNATSAPDSR